MRIADVDFILVPEWLARPSDGQPDDDHWISRWQRNFANARWLQVGRDEPPQSALVTQAGASKRSTIVVTHGHGVDVLVGASGRLAGTPVIGAFIVAPAPSPAVLQQHQGALGFRSILIAPSDHPDHSAHQARQFADRLGSFHVDAGAAGRLNSASGQGPWPEGLLKLGWFLKQLTVH